MSKKIILFFTLLSFSFGCCCTPQSCNPVKTTLSKSISLAETKIVKNDQIEMAAELQKIQKLQQEILKVQATITQLQNYITAVRKIEALYLNHISKQLLERNSLMFLLNRQINGNAKSFNLLNKMFLLKEK